MYGLYMGRELFPTGTVYFSQDTHHSVVKLLRLLNIRNVMIRSQDNGEMDYLDLRETVRRDPDTPPIIVANIGTTMKGAVDDLNIIRDVMDGLQVQNFYVHADAALSGMILPFVPDPQPHGFDAGIDSISISGHKLIGSPLPCGVVLTKKDYVANIARSIEVVGVMDTTIPGSRSAIAPPHHPARLPETRAGGLPGHRGQDDGHRRVRRHALWRGGHTRLAEPERGHRRLPPPRTGGLPEMADRAPGGHRPHHRHAPRHKGDARRAALRLRQAGEIEQWRES